jgi:hypothetical protein
VCTICVSPAYTCSPGRQLSHTGTRGGSVRAHRRVRRRCDTPLECPSELAAGGARHPSDRYGAALCSTRGSRASRGARRPASTAAVQCVQRELSRWDRRLRCGPCCLRWRHAIRQPLMCS